MPQEGLGCSTSPTAREPRPSPRTWLGSFCSPSTAKDYPGPLRVVCVVPVSTSAVLASLDLVRFRLWSSSHKEHLCFARNFAGALFAYGLSSPFRPAGRCWDIRSRPICCAHSAAA